MHAAGVVADHAAERVVVVGGGIGAEGQAVLRGFRAQVVEDAAGFDAGEAALGIDRDHAVEVLGEVDHDGGVAALAGEARAAAARQKRRIVTPADLHRLDDVLPRLRDDHPDRDLAVVRGVGGVERAAAVIEADLAVERGLKLLFVAPWGRGRAYPS